VARFNYQLPLPPVVLAQITSAGNEMMCGVCVMASYMVMSVLSAGLRGTHPVGRTFKACNCALISPNTVVYVVISLGNALVVTLLTGWLLSMKYFSSAFAILEFFRATDDSLVCDHLRWYYVSVSCYGSCSKSIP